MLPDDRASTRRLSPAPFAPFALLALLASGCATAPATGDSAAVRPATASEVGAAEREVDEARLLRHISTLASDEFEGRAPGSRGETLTVAFLTDQFRRAGLQPGNPDGSWVQRVSLVGFRAQPEGSFRAGGRNISLRFPDDYVAVSRRFDLEEARVRESEVVFVGYGVVAPEYGWNDYEGLDVRGKTVVMLINDPGYATRDAALFRGQAMTYYGRWTYKYEEASRQGAAAAVIVHQTGPAGYPYEVVRNSWGAENFDIRTPDDNAGRVPVEAWITEEKARELFAAGWQDFDALSRAAERPGFRPVRLGATADFRVRNTTREVQSQNVIGKLEGGHPERRHEYIVYTAHWDHFGRDGDEIYNGAVDNATGTAGLIEMARAFAALPRRPDRSILFLAVTAEERGLLGAKHYASQPLYPLERTLANINMDVLNVWGRTRDVVVVGLGNSTLDDVLREAAGAQGRTLRPDPEPEKGFYFRSDHFEFAKQGVPALYINAGVDFIDKPEGYGERKRAEYNANHYHKPADTVRTDWDLGGAVEDLRLLFRVGLGVAQADRWPEWQPGTEFRARREEMLRQAATR
jgi:Zn-dependent M28 family amino/carboxypeptidase